MATLNDSVAERALILASLGRDAAIAAAILREAGFAAQPCPSLPDLIVPLDAGAGFVVVTEEALATTDLSALIARLKDQEEWSDLPFVLLTYRGGGLERNPAATRYLDVLGNVTFLERPFHPTTLVSLARSALRARRRQYEARARLAALRESEARYHALFENIDEGFCIIEFLDGPHGPLSDYIRVEANPACAIHTGLPDAVGRTVRELVPEEADHWVASFRRVLETGEAIRFERELAATHRYLDLAAFRVEPASRRQVAVVFRDVTERQHAEQALRELNETLERRVAEALAEQKLLADVVEGTDAVVQVADLDFRWLAINRAAANEFERIYGVRPKVGQSMLDLLAEQPGHQRDVRAVWERALAGEEFTEVAAFGDPGRDRRFYEMRYNTLRDKAGRRIGAYQFVYDVTERLAAQDRLAQAEEALRQAQKMEAVGQLTGGVAHDFNNLLTIIRSSTDLLRRPNLADDRRRRYVDAISDTVDRASKLTGQLLAFARRQALKPEVFDACARVESIADMLRTVVGSRVKIVTDVDRERCVVEADMSQFETALVNMVVNARDAMNGEGRLTIRVTNGTAMPAIRGHADSSGPCVAVSIADTGSGIPPERLPHIFEPFYTTKEVGKGTGLGLSQVYGFAKQSGGDIAVESEVGRGTTFTLYLPRIDEAMTLSAAPDMKGGLDVADGLGRRVLVVEDNMEVGAFSTQLLQDLGYETTWATNAAEALRLLSGVTGFDVVFSDVVMPGMSGIELGQEIRRLHPNLPVVLTSGYSHVLAEEGRHGFELLHKPYAAEDLSRVLRRATREHDRNRMPN
ncbi:PAS domain-containing protein [Microvirga sesbaniae]|uniref:PAS domain-containing protein n=1 Tax=Microvirga sesbaniae TaxID=681392 RepID=UPI0021C5F421|nr:PAS domain-containing protein [Microvirga sp. HBU67692]